jgi:hypothetical protein
MLNWLWANSWPPLKPMENRRYREINLDELAGISKSLFNLTAIIPRIKNKNAGLVRLSTNKLRLVCSNIYFSDFVFEINGQFNLFIDDLLHEQFIM